MKKKTRKTIINVLKYVIGLVGGILLFYWAVGSIDKEDFFDGLKRANYFYILLALFIALLSHFFRAIRWKMMLNSLGYKPKLWATYASLMVGYGFNNLVPRGGELARCSVLYKAEDVPVSVSMGTVITERIFDLIILLLMVGTIFALEFDTLMAMFERLGQQDPGQPQQDGMSLKTIVMIVVGAMAVLGVVGFVVFRKRIMKTKIFQKASGFVKQMLQAAMRVAKLDKPFLFIFHTIMIWVCYVVMTYIPFLALKETSHLSFYFGAIVLTIGGLGIAFPSPGGTGSYHVAVKETFRAFGHDANDGTIIATIIHASQMVMTTVVGSIGFLMLEVYRKRKQKQST